MTLIEVMLAIAIMAVMAVMAASALFYPSYLVVTSALEQNAIHAASAEIERRLHGTTNIVALGRFYMTGWSLADAPPDIVTTVSPTNVVSGDVCQYYKITSTITYRGDKQVKLETYRSREVTSSFR